ncbi:MAG: hypothetical protein L6Q92_01105 [Phycisphaerae bacterium]|nr:hypothetical protein [Phycisphaerae bacterium]
MNHRVRFILALAAMSGLACDSSPPPTAAPDPSPTKASTPPAGQAPAPTPVAQKAAEKPTPPPEKAPAVPPTASPSTPTGMTDVSFQDFTMTVPSTWMARSTANPMRLAQFTWPTVGEDKEAPELIVFFFGVGSGGGVQANIDRWSGQFEEKEAGKTESINGAHGKITIFDKTGTFKLQPSMMAPDYTPKPGWRMLAAVIECDGGPIFLRATGPAASMGEARNAFVAAAKSLRPRASQS